MFKKLLNTFIHTNEKDVKHLRKRVEAVNALESGMKALSDEALAAKTAEFKERLAAGETLDQLLPEAFAVVREAAFRVLGMRHFDVQLMGGMVLHDGRIAEMKTGEGKTLVATAPVYLNALTGKGVHVVTVNDYLARRDSEWMGKVYKFLGLSVGLIVPGMETEERKTAYACDVTFCTNNELGFDYLRDNMAIYKEQTVLRPLHYAVVDEVDSILIDEARTPLIISGMAYSSEARYQEADRFVRSLKAEDYEFDEKQHTAFLTDSGTEKAEAFYQIENYFEPENQETAHLIHNALKAHLLMKKDVDYMVKDDAVLIVDQFTGRVMFGRQYSDGLHQAIEAKEQVEIKQETKTMATITFQNFFRMYEKLSGMTGTAMTEEKEFIDIYGMDVVEIPTNLPLRRIDQPDLVFANGAGKWRAIIEEIRQSHAKGQPVLVGTVSIEKSEMLSALLKRAGVPHQVLNAKHHEREAEIVAQAGRFGTVTIATNMAGRGTDIMLGGNPDFAANRKLREEGVEPELLAEATSFREDISPEAKAVRTRYREVHAAFKAQMQEEHEKILQVGGLKVLGTERHESRRIDNQLRGRSGRQGDPGESRFYIAMDDDIMRLFGENIQGLMTKIGMEEDEPLEHNLLSRSIEKAQKRVEDQNYNSRRYLLEYDTVMNKQREVIYGQRSEVLAGGDFKGQILSFMNDWIDAVVDTQTADQDSDSTWDYASMNQTFGFFMQPEEYPTAAGRTPEELKALYKQLGEDHYNEKEKHFAEAGLDYREVERVMFLRSIDRHWIDHIDGMEQLKQGINLRAYGQVDPKQAYRTEGFEMFQQLIEDIQHSTVRAMFGVRAEVKVKRETVAQPIIPREAGAVRQPVKKQKQVGRNDPCPCGSGLKYKKCCGKDE